MWRAFINRVRDNLHLVLAMSPVGEAFRARCRQFPSLINCCTIDWWVGCGACAGCRQPSNPLPR